MICAALPNLKTARASVTPLLSTPGSALMLVGSPWTGELQNCAVSITGDNPTSCSVTNRQQTLKQC